MGSFVVSSPCRTGSTIILNNLLKNKNNTVVHNHNSEWQPPNSNFVCILSRRKDRFAAVVSHAVMDATKQPPHTYSSTVVSLTINVNRFRNLYLSHKIFYSKINLDSYKQVVEIWYEELISDPYYLFRELGQHQQTDYTTIPKSPYDYSKLITNYVQLQEVAKKIEQDLLYIK